jgi:multidrug efflux pump subunit AcrA (membrane-fusion protein)
MSDIVNAFKQTKGYKKRKNLLSDTQEVAQTNTQEPENTALQASQQDNIAYNTSGTRDSDRLAQLEQLAAAETAQNEANRQAAVAAEEARKQAEEAQKRVQEQQMSRADASRRNFDDINNGTNNLYNDYVDAYNATKSSYKNILGDSASGTANYHINNVLNKIKDKDENALSSSQSFMNAYNQLSSDINGMVYQNLTGCENEN